MRIYTYTYDMNIYAILCIDTLSVFSSTPGTNRRNKSQDFFMRDLRIRSFWLCISLDAIEG